MSDRNKDSTPTKKPLTEQGSEVILTKPTSKTPRKPLTEFKPVPEKPLTRLPDKLHLVDTWDTSPWSPYTIDVSKGGQVFFERIFVGALSPRINVFTKQGSHQSEWVVADPGGFAISGSLRGLAIDNRTDDGRIYLALQSSNLIHVLNRDGTTYSNWYGIVPGGANLGSSSEISPYGVVVLPDGNLIISCNYSFSLNFFTPDGTLIKRFGSVGSNPGELRNPHQLAYDDRNGDIYVVEQYNHRIQVFDESGNCRRLWGGLGLSDGQFNSPCGVALDKSRDLVYVSDTLNNRIQVFKTDGSFLALYGDDGLGEPQNMTLDSEGRLYVTFSDINKVKVFEYRQ